MKLTSIVYQTFLAIYRALPFKPYLARIIRWLPFDKEKIYRDLHFKGVFSTQSLSGSFKMNHLKTTIENELFWHGLGNTMEADTVWIWQALCAKSNLVLDIGANTGVYSLIAKVENKNAHVYAFEPSIKIYPELVANVLLNSFDIKCEKIALSNSNETQVFYDLDSLAFPTSGSLSSAKLKDLIKDRSDIREYEVHCSTLDDFISEKKLNHIDLMKIDVELHEPEVFEGFKKLQEFRPTILVEVLTEDVANKIKSISDLSNYRFFKLADVNHVIEMPEIMADSEHRNYLLLPSELELPFDVLIEKN